MREYKLNFERIKTNLIKVKNALSTPISVPFIFISGFVILFAIGSFLYANSFSSRPKTEAQKASEENAEDVKKLVSEVSRIIELPNETPNVATVNDLEKLKSGSASSFFEKAKVGDKVLIFPTSGKTILYRPSERKVLEISTLIK